MPKSPRKPPTARRIEIVAFPDMTALDLTGPLEVFTIANQLAMRSGLPLPYGARAVAERGPVTACSGFSFLADPLPDPSTPIEVVAIAKDRSQRLRHWPRGVTRPASSRSSL